MKIHPLEAAAVGLSITRLGISFMPVYLAANDLPEISTGSDSGLQIDELDQASVPTLVARNPTATPILAVEGEHFIGGKQNRALNATVLVPPRSELKIPVSCLEQGRWGRRRAYARSAAFAPPSVRRKVNEGVHASMAFSSSRRGDQGAVWDEVSGMLGRLRMASRTDAAEDLNRAPALDEGRHDQAEELIRRGPLPHQCGIAVAHGKQILAIELFGTPQLLVAHWQALVRSYLLERPASDGFPSTTAVLLMLRKFRRSESSEAPGVGMGVERRVKARDFFGQALMLDSNLVHASIFTRPQSTAS